MSLSEKERKIKKITAIKDIGSFADFNWDANVPDFEKNNIIFGYNGSGKTILSNIFHLFSSKREDGGEKLFNDLKNSDQALAKIQLDENEIAYRTDCTKHDIFVFNSDFVREHVYDGSVSRCKEFDSSVVTDEQLKNPEIQELESRIEVLRKDVQHKNAEKDRLDETFEEIKSKLATEFNSNISGTRRLEEFSDLLLSENVRNTGI